MDEDLKQYLDDHFEKQGGDMRDLREEMRDDILHLREDMRQIETNLLTAFHNWARPMEIKQRNASTVVAGFDERMSLIEERVGKLERRETN